MKVPNSLTVRRNSVNLRFPCEAESEEISFEKTYYPKFLGLTNKIRGEKQAIQKQLISIY